MAKKYSSSTLPPESIVPVNDCLNYVTFWLDEWTMQKIRALVELEEHQAIYTFLRYQVIKTGLECLRSNTEEIGAKFVKQLEGKKEG